MKIKKSLSGEQNFTVIFQSQACNWHICQG